MSLFFQRYVFSFLSFLFLFSFRAPRLGIGARPSISIIKGGFDILPLPGAVESIADSLIEIRSDIREIEIERRRSYI